MMKPNLKTTQVNVNILLIYTHAAKFLGYSIDNEDESVLRFKSISNSPPSLLSSCILSVCAALNQKACDPQNRGMITAAILCQLAYIASIEQVRAFWDEHVKILPENLKAKITSQCAFSTLKCLHDSVWEIELELLLGRLVIRSHPQI
jgi:hypothetical protein